MTADHTTREGEKKLREQGARVKVEKGSSFGVPFMRDDEGVLLYVRYSERLKRWMVWARSPRLGTVVTGEGRTIEAARLRRVERIELRARSIQRSIALQ